MRIHKEGYKILIFGFLFLLLLNVAIDFIFSDLPVLKWICLVSSFLLYIFLLFFFRLPLRKFKPDPGLIYAPADGKVVVIEEAVEKEYFKSPRLQVSIFMSPLNVHSNRYPISGKIKYTNYHPGKYIVAWHPKSSELNEHSTVVIETSGGAEILIKQIAGAVARRIVTYAKKDQEVHQGDELGFIKFGSRVDIFLPLDTEIEVPILQHVRANRTIIAKIN